MAASGTVSGKAGYRTRDRDQITFLESGDVRRGDGNDLVEVCAPALLVCVGDVAPGNGPRFAGEWGRIGPVRSGPASEPTARIPVDVALSAEDAKYRALPTGGK